MELAGHIGGHKCQPSQQDHGGHKRPSQQYYDDHRYRSQQSITAQHVSTYLHATIIATFSRRVFGLTRLRTPQHDLPQAQQDHFKSTKLLILSFMASSFLQIIRTTFIFVRRTSDVARLRPAPKPLRTSPASFAAARTQEHDTACHFLPASLHHGRCKLTWRFCPQQIAPSTKSPDSSFASRTASNIKSLTLRPLPHLKAIIFWVMTFVHNLLALAWSHLTCLRSSSRQPHTDHHMTTPHYDKQSTTSSTVVSIAMRPPMHWIQNPAAFTKMQHGSHAALYRESALANTYVPTPFFTHTSHEQQLTSSQGLPRLA